MNPLKVTMTWMHVHDGQVGFVLVMLSTLTAGRLQNRSRPLVGHF